MIYESLLDPARRGNFTPFSVLPLNMIRFSSRLCRCWASVSLFVALASTGRGALESNLVSQSPFLPPGWGKQTAPVKPVEEAPVVQGPLGRELEFRGIFEMGGVTQFSVFDKTTQKGQWITLNGGTDRFSIVRYNSDKDSIVIQAGGRSEELKLATADDKPIPIVGQAPPNFSPPTPAPNFVPPTPPPSSPPSSSPPTTIPPPPPAALLEARRNGQEGGTPRRRIITRGDGNTSDSGSSGSNSQTGPSGGPPSSAPGAPPSGAPPTPPPNYVPSRN